MTSFNFTDELGFEEGLASPSDLLNIRDTQGGNLQVSGNVRFTEHGVYAQCASSGPYGQGLIFYPWSNLKSIFQEL